MSTYLSRVEHIGDYYNVRPILEGILKRLLNKKQKILKK